MNLEIDEFLDHVDLWKLKLHKKLKPMTPAQRKAFWNRIHEEARTEDFPSSNLRNRLAGQPNEFDAPTRIPR